MQVDTIVSLSTPRGVGAIAIVRLSGPESFTVAHKLLPREKSSPEVRRPTLTDVLDPESREVLDRAVVTFFEGPASYTGENMVEFSCHGGYVVPGLVEDACRRGGARQADPGEFTRRAYLHGKLDLTQAEAVADLIEARSRASHRAAVRQLDRGLSARVAALRGRLVGVEAMLAHHIDFPEEDDAPVPLATVRAEAEEIASAIEAMLATAPGGALLREGAVVVLAGRPNAGKSSLYNALLGEERAIVTDEPGTTRDALETAVQLGGFPFRLVDTAGLRDTEGPIERMGIEVARRYLERADGVLYCIPSTEGPTAEDLEFLSELEGVPVVVAATKRDEGSPGSWMSEMDGCAARVETDVLSGAGIDDLQDVLANLLYGAVLTAGAEDPVLMRERHARGLGTAAEEIRVFLDAVDAEVPVEIAATHLRSAESALEEVVGVVGVEDVLDRVFREFCVGK